MTTHDSEYIFDFYCSEKYEKWLEEIHKRRGTNYVKCYFKEHRWNWVRKQGIPNNELKDATHVGSGKWGDCGYHEPYKKL